MGKTVNSLALAECFASKGRKTLLIDADHQSMSGELAVGITRCDRANSRKRTFYDLLRDMLQPDMEEQDYGKYVIPCGSNIKGGLRELDVMPCSIRLEGIQSNIARAKQGFLESKEFDRRWNRHKDRFRRWLKQNYRHVIIDCPPILMDHVRFLLRLSDGFIIPCVPDALSVRGADYLMSRVGQYGIKTPGIGIMWTMFRDTKPHQATIARAKKREAPFDNLPVPFESKIPHATQIIRTTEPDMTFSSFRAKYDKFGADYDGVGVELIRRLKALGIVGNEELQ